MTEPGLMSDDQVSGGGQPGSEFGKTGSSCPLTVDLRQSLGK